MPRPTSNAALAASARLARALFTSHSRGAAAQAPAGFRSPSTSAGSSTPSVAMAAKNRSTRPSWAPAPTRTTCPRRSTSSCCAASSTRPTRPTSRRSRRARCRPSSSSRPSSRCSPACGRQRLDVRRRDRRAEAALLALRLKKDAATCSSPGRSTRATARWCNLPRAPRARRLVELPLRCEDRPHRRGGAGKALDARTALVLLQQPNFFGVVEDVQRRGGVAHAPGPCSASRSPKRCRLACSRSPGALGADIAVGELQSFGNGADLRRTGRRLLRRAGGVPAPAARSALRRDGRPGGRRGFVLTLSTREQHIRRENATSNICTNTGLCALAATIHLALLGKRGLRELALLNYRRARYAQQKLGRAALQRPHLQRVRRPRRRRPALPRRRQRGISAGVALRPRLSRAGADAPHRVTELHDKARIDALVAALRRG